MADALLGLLIAIIVVGIVVLIAIKLLDLVPMDARFKSIATLLIYLVAALVIIQKAWPILTSAI